MCKLKCTPLRQACLSTLHISHLQKWSQRSENLPGMSCRKWSINRLPVHPIAPLGRGTAGSYGTQGDNMRNGSLINMCSNVMTKMVLGH